MSQEQAKAFIANMKSDAAFRENVGALAEVDERRAFIHREGFTCTVPEIAQVQGELSEAELQTVAGGGCVEPVRAPTRQTNQTEPSRRRSRATVRRQFCRF